MKKIIRTRIVITLLALAVFLGVLPGIAFAQEGNLSGRGLPTDPYQIHDYQDLKAFAKIVNGMHQDIPKNASACAVLEADIIAKDSLSDTDDRDWKPMGGISNPYNGTFDGNGYEIVGLNIPGGNGDNYVGLFGFIGSQGTVSNLGLIDGTISGNVDVGGVAGYSGGYIMNCYNTCAVSGKSNVGGVVGHAVCCMGNCYNNGKVSGTSTVGGVVGYADDGNFVSGLITNCYNTGAVSGYHYIGGVAGYQKERVLLHICYNTGAVSYLDIANADNFGGVVGCTKGSTRSCYNAGAISGSHFLGGVAGYVDTGGIVSNCYSAGQLFGGDTDTGGVVGTNRGTVENAFFDCGQTSITEVAVGSSRGTAKNVGALSADQMTGMDAIGPGHIAFDYYSVDEYNPWLLKENESGTCGTLYYPHLMGFDFAKNGQRVEFPLGITGDCEQMTANQIPDKYWPPKIKTADSVTLSSPTYAAKDLLPELTVVKDGQTLDADSLFKVTGVGETTSAGQHQVTLTNKKTGIKTTEPFTIQKRDLIITANNQEYPYNNGLPQGEGDTAYDNSEDIEDKVTVSGLQGSDRLTSILIDGQAEEVGDYPGRLEPQMASIGEKGALNGNYSIHYVNGMLTITPLDMKVTVNDYSGVYDGAAHSIAVSAPAGSAITYAKAGGAFASDKPAFTDAGEYTVKYKVEKKNYNTFTGSGKVTIAKAAIEPAVSIEGWTYGSDANRPVVSGNTGGGAENFLYKEKGAPDSAYTSDVPKEAGQYTVLARIAETDNYLAATATVDMTISPADMQVTASDYSGTYDGAAHSITVSAPDGAKVTYAKAGESFSAKNPAFADAGEYTVDFRVTRDNYSEFSGSQKVKIAKAAITIKADDRSSEYGKALQELTYTVGGAYVRGDDLGVALSTDAKKDVPGTYPIKVSWNGNPNYEAALTDGTYSVGDAPPVPPEPKPDPPKPTPVKKVTGTLMTKMNAKGERGLALSWSRIKGADGYEIFFAACNANGRDSQCRKAATIRDGNTTKFTKTGLKKGAPYKAYVKAYVMKHGKKKYVKKSFMVHAYTGGYTKHYTNARGVSVKKARVSLQKGKTFKIKARVVKLKKGKKLMPSDHVAKLRYFSTNKKVATVSKSGRIKAKGKGKCNIYVIAHNGVKKAVKVIVK